jgi:PAS domain S-box-containing protein
VNLGMSAPHALSVALLAGAAGIALLLSLVAWRRRDVPGATAFGVLMVSAAIWAAFYALELAVPGLANKVACLKIEYVGIVATPPAWLVFTLAYTGRATWLTPGRLALLIALPLATLLLALTNEAHGLMWRAILLDESGAFAHLRITRGPWYWVNIAFAYLALGAGTLLLLQTLRRAPRLHRRSAGALLFGVLSPWLANIVYQSGLMPIPDLDPTPLAFAVAGLAFAHGLFQFRFLDVFLGLVPVAREAIVDSMRDGVIVLDPRGRLVDINPAAERMIGSPALEVLGQPVAAVLAGWPAAALGDRPEATVLAEFELDTGAKPRTLDLQVLPLSRDDGRRLGHLIVVRDVTARHQAERRLALLVSASSVLGSSLDYEHTLGQLARLVVPGLADYCFVDTVDADGTIRGVAAAHIDPERADLLREMRRRYPPDPAAPYGVAKVIRTGEPEFMPRLPPALLTTAARDAEHLKLFETLDPTSYMIAPLVARGRILGAISFGVTHDRWRYEPDDLALAEELARRAAVAIDNARLFAEVEAAVSLREEFLGIAAHELKTPLTTLKGYVQLGGRLVQAPALDAKRLANVNVTLERQVKRLEELVSDLLDVARVQRGQLALRPVPIDLVDLARQVLDRFEQATERTARHRLVLEADGPVTGSWDPHRLDQVLTNLVSNALKYSPAGGEVRVRVERQAEHAVVSVRDQGLGIAPEEQARLFQPFARGTTGRGIQGVGLGLYIARQIVAQHGGTLTVESTPGAGSTFTIRL